MHHSACTQIRNRHFFVSDLVLLTCASYFSFVLRLGTYNLAPYWIGYTLFCSAAFVVTPLVFLLNRVYTHYWQYARIDELLLLVRSMTIAGIVVTVIVMSMEVLFFDTLLVPRSVPFIFWLLGIAGVTAPRLLVCLSPHETPYQSSAKQPARVLIIGTGATSALIAHELRHPVHRLDAVDLVGFVDDDPTKHHMRIHNVPVLGGVEQTPAIIHNYAVDQVIIALPNASGKLIRQISASCDQLGVATKIAPSIHELLDNRISINQLRDVQIEDLLRRAPVQIDTTAVRTLLHGKRVLITGGGGSIGSELCRQVFRCKPAELIILGHGENSVFTIQNELQRLAAGPRRTGAPAAMEREQSAAASCKLVAVIADIRFADRLRAVFEAHRPDVVIHAAAHKHVPLMEENLVEAISNNVLGTRNVLAAASSVGTQRFVMISTDKAVNPTSVMGASKRLAELLVHQTARAHGSAYMAVRFGNVLGSRGSVVLTFQQQIAAGGPVTVTHPEMQRFFMTIPEAVQLALQAAALGQGGEVFTLDMGQPVRIVDLARDMIELSGLEVGRDIDIAFSGIRPGEKLYEELFIAGEAYDRTVHDKIFLARNASSFVPAGLNCAILTLEIAAQGNDHATIMRVLQQFVPHLKHTHVCQAVQQTPAPVPLQARTVGE